MLLLSPFSLLCSPSSYFACLFGVAFSCFIFFGGNLTFKIPPDVGVTPLSLFILFDQLSLTFAEPFNGFDGVVFENTLPDDVFKSRNLIKSI